MQGRLLAVLKLGLLISLCCWVGKPLCAAPGDGRFELKRWDLSRSLVLDGHWLYMPGRFLEPHELEDILDHDYQDLKVLRFGATGEETADEPPYGTYILRLAQPQKLEELALFHNFYQASAKSQVFCRNQPLRSLSLNMGQVGASVTSSTPKLSSFAIQNLKELARLPICSELVIMLQVSSFHHSAAGLWLPPRLGQVADFQDLVSQQKQSYAFILGILLLLGLGAVRAAFGRGRPKTSLLLALGVFILGLRIAALFHANSTESGSTPWLWQLENLVIHSAVYLLPWLALKSLKALVPGAQLGRPWDQLVNGMVALAFLTQVLTPVRVWSHAAGVLPLLGLSLVVMMLYFLGKAMRQGKALIWPQLLGVLFAFSGMLLVLLVDSRLIDWLPLNIPDYGLAIWISLQLSSLPAVSSSPSGSRKAWRNSKFSTRW